MVWPNEKGKRGRKDNQLIDLYEAWNKPEKAEQWRIKLPQIEAEVE